MLKRSNDAKIARRINKRNKQKIRKGNPRKRNNVCQKEKQPLKINVKRYLEEKELNLYN